MVKILLSNDDGVSAIGLQTLAAKLSQIAEITVVAPDRNRSGASNSLSLEDPLRVKQTEKGHYSVDGTPTDCVHLAVTGMLDHMPDMVVSGINNGENMGDDILYSGTVAAATEGRFLGFPAIAVSLATNGNNHFDTAAEIVKTLVAGFLKNPMSGDTILNVNIPDIPFSEIKGLKVTRLGTRHLAEPTVKSTDPRGRVIYWVGEAGKQADAGEGTDFHAVKNGYVSITPIKVDLTHHDVMKGLASWLESIEVEV